jgi:hypothetical protein
VVHSLNQGGRVAVVPSSEISHGFEVHNSSFFEEDFREGFWALVFQAWLVLERCSQQVPSVHPISHIPQLVGVSVFLNLKVEF